MEMGTGDLKDKMGISMVAERRFQLLGMRRVPFALCRHLRSQGILWGFVGEMVLGGSWLREYNRGLRRLFSRLRLRE